MPLGLIFGALAPEAIIYPLLTGDGSASTTATARAYDAMAKQLRAAAANTDGSMGQMGGAWGGLSADQAQAAFRNHANWLREQAEVAERTADIANKVVTIYSGAHKAMTAVAAWCETVRARESAAALGSGVFGAAALVVGEAEAELLLVRAAAVDVMLGYAGALLPTLAALPTPVVAPPIVAGGDPGPTMDLATYDDPTSYRPTDTRTGTTETTSSTRQIGSNGDGDTNGGGDNGSNGGGDNGSGGKDLPTQPTDPTDSATPTDPQQFAPDPSSLPGDSSANGFDSGASDQWLYGASQNSPTLAGLNGGVGSLVAINMMRGGLGSMPGASTGFRMPSSWLRAPGASFGPTSNPVSAGPATRGGPPRRVVAANARMRRRRRDEERKPGKVFVPGEQFEVPVLEKPPVIGVIEYTDRPEESDTDQDVLVGVIERSDDDADSNTPVLPR
ncbi:PPE domain-containing protein [Nocardia sp. CA-084685]|uniref:PPE domain-containing protein n=1 Tax=Nocardia sp. CA-084685 TaxID=3239970 RepID=UPI003D991347